MVHSRKESDTCMEGAIACSQHLESLRGGSGKSNTPLFLCVGEEWEEVQGEVKQCQGELETRKQEQAAARTDCWNKLNAIKVKNLCCRGDTD